MTEIERLDDIVRLIELTPGKTGHFNLSIDEVSVFWETHVDPYGTSEVSMTAVPHSRGGVLVNVSYKRKLRA